MNNNISSSRILRIVGIIVVLLLAFFIVRRYIRRHSTTANKVPTSAVTTAPASGQSTSPTTAAPTNASAAPNANPTTVPDTSATGAATSPTTASNSAPAGDSNTLVDALSPECKVTSVKETATKRQNQSGGGGYSAGAAPLKDPQTLYVAQQDPASQKFQIYRTNSASGQATCLTCQQKAGGPAVNTEKEVNKIDPSGQYILAQVEVANHQFPQQKVNPGFGTWFDLWMYDIKNDQWSNLTNYPNRMQGTAIYGSLIPQITGDWKTIAWAEEYKFTKPKAAGGGLGSGELGALGTWRINIANVAQNGSKFALTNLQHYYPGSNAATNENFYETQDISSDNRWLLFNSDIHNDSSHKLNVYKLDLQNPTAEPILITNFADHNNQWSEHATFSNDGTKVVYESSRGVKEFNITQAVKTLSSELYMVNSDGTGPTAQLTHFNEPGYPESQTGKALYWAGKSKFSPDGTTITFGTQVRKPGGSVQLLPASFWQLTFAGSCGGSRTQ